jgi:antitoxin component of MazEF toxin-antitoxin module
VAPLSHRKLSGGKLILCFGLKDGEILQVTNKLVVVVNDDVDYSLETGQSIVGSPVQKFAQYSLSELLSQELEPEPEIECGQPHGAEEW